MRSAAVWLDAHDWIHPTGKLLSKGLFMDNRREDCLVNIVIHKSKYMKVKAQF